MKQDYFERLKAICEKEGFDIVGPWDEGFIVFNKKDPWEGVEFVEFIGGSDNCFTNSKIYKVNHIYYGWIGICVDDEGDKNGWNKSKFKPSNETAYVEQLKKEAFERFGEIKEGDRFTRLSHIGEDVVKNIGRFAYDKCDDAVHYSGIHLYNKGKWAERVKERVEVVPLNIQAHNRSEKFTVDFTFSIKGHFKILNGTQSFLASQLEKFLNGEVE